MRKTIKLAPLVTTVATTLLAAHGASATENPFLLKHLPGGYQLAAASPEAASDRAAPTDSHPHHARHSHSKKGHAKTKEGTCAAEHRKIMQGACGAKPTTSDEKPAK